MNRLVGVVPAWSLYLHRSARGLRRAALDDGRKRQLEDELFERLFAGELEPLSQPPGDQAAHAWAQRIHDTVGQLPAFDRLGQECRGRADEAALAVEAIIDELPDDAPDDVVRREVRRACGRASQSIEELREAMEGLVHVQVSAGAGDGTSRTGAGPEAPAVRSLAAKLRDSPRLRQLARMAGRFRRLADAKRRGRVRHGADEIVDVERGADLARLLPLELALLAHPRTRLLALRNLHERQCLQYRLEGTEALGRGPLVVAIDKSGSMEGERDLWSTAVAIALLGVAQAERRPFALICFDGAVKFEAVVLPGEALPEAGLLVPADGGTAIAQAIERGLDVIEAQGRALRKADLVLITDGESDASRASELRARAAAIGATVLGVAIDVEPARLMPWCDQVIAANDMSRIDDQSAEVLFAGP